MTFENTLFDVTKKMEKRKFDEETRKVCSFERELLEETVKLLDVDVNAKGMAVLKVDTGEITKVVSTNKIVGYFEDMLNKTVYVSGIKVPGNKKKNEKWFICTCMDVTDREYSLAKCDKFSEAEKVEFQRSIEMFGPDIQKDLCDKKIILADKKTKEDAESELTLYREPAELNAYYDIVKKVIPREFRDVYETARYRREKNCSSSEKRNYLKQMADILDFDWVGNADYKDIDIEELRKKIQKEHIGHRRQIEEICTEFEASNISKIAPKTFCLIGHPDTGINQLSEIIASSIGSGYSVINLAGIHMKETEALTGTSKIYENARAGLIYERIKEAGVRGALVIEDFDLYDSGIRNALTPLVEKTNYVDKFIEVAINLTDMFVIVTCSDIKDIPMSLRANMTTIYFQDAEENEIIKTINKIIVPKYCAEYGIDFPKMIPDDCCRTLIYKYANMDMNKLDSVIRSIVIKTVTGGKKEFPDYNVRKINEFDYDDDYDKTRNEYVREITATEHKFFSCYDEYPESIQKKGIRLFEILNWGSDERQKEYAMDVIHYIANIFMGNNESLVIGSVIEELSKTHYLQNDFGVKIEAAILSKELEKNTNRMTVIGLDGNAGTGKSSMAINVARALNRNCIKINVGGAGGAEIIKGTNKTVHNAGPSMIVRELAKTGHGCYSDVILLDEVDKATPDFFNALYEFLDPNEEFIYDQYLECHIPKNNFIVIVTFNEIGNIPIPIRDRMEIIECSNYSIQDKKVIIEKYILPKLQNKFTVDELTIDSNALDLYVNQYDVAPGMRNVERDFEFILMSIARANKGKLKDIVNIDKRILQDVLGEIRTVGLNDVPPRSVGKCGMAQALAITTGGIGVSTAVETVINPYQDKDVVVTGLLEGSCLESVSIACCFASKYMKNKLPKLHIHMTDAVKKDGPSAGITIVMSILSCILEKPLPNIAFTGSIDLYGNMGPVGGVFEKCIAAERTLVKKVIVPSECYRRLVDRKEIDRLNIEVIPVDTVEEAIECIWGEEV